MQLSGIATGIPVHPFGSTIESDSGAGSTVDSESTGAGSTVDSESTGAGSTVDSESTGAGSESYATHSPIFFSFFFSLF